MEEETPEEELKRLKEELAEATDEKEKSRIKGEI